MTGSAAVPPAGPPAAPQPDLDFGPAGYLYATHALHAFAARCPPPLVSWAIRSYSPEGGVVLDPMMGSGTTLVEACLSGRKAWGAEIDPLGRLIAVAKATPVELARFDKAAARAERLLAGGDLDDGWRPRLAGLDRWFRADVARDLAGLRVAIARVTADEPSLRPLLWAAFSSLIVSRTSVANARDLVHSRHHYRLWERNPDVPRRFRLRLRQLRRMMEDYRRRLEAVGCPEPSVRVAGDDARSLPLPSGTVDLVFTSPPYCSALDYTRAHLFAVAWLSDVLGVSVDEYRELGRRYIGSERAPLSEATRERPLPPPSGCEEVDRIVTALTEDPKRAWIVYRYFRDMAKVLRECARLTRPGGYVVMVVCPSNIRKVPVPTHRVLAALAAAPAAPDRLELVDLKERTIHDRRRVMPYIESAFGPRMRTEYVMVLRRAGRVPT